MVRVLCFLLAWSGASAHADVIDFSDRAAFIAASTDLETIDFEGLPSRPEFGVLLVNDVGFSGVNGVIPVAAPNFGYTGPGTALVNIGVPEVSSINVTLPREVKAIGTDLLANPPDNISPIVVTLSTGDTFTFTGEPLPVRQFLGFTSDVPITSLHLVSNSGPHAAASRIGVDDLVFSQVQTQSIPEPTTLILLTTGLAALAAAFSRASSTHSHPGAIHGGSRNSSPSP
jgi:hypothetical protein